MKRVAAMLIAGCMMVSALAACGASDAPAENKAEASAENTKRQQMKKQRKLREN